MEDKFKRLRREADVSVEQQKQKKEEEGQLAIIEGNEIQKMVESEGFKILKKEFIDRGLDIHRFIGCRPGKLMWMQGFMACLDAFEEFLSRKMVIRNRIIADMNRTTTVENDQLF